jgi:hypothetical protein
MRDEIEEEEVNVSFGVCQKCRGTGIMKNKDGSCSTCIDCLIAGKLDQHSDRLPDSKIKLWFSLVYMFKKLKRWYYQSRKSHLESEISLFESHLKQINGMQVSSNIHQGSSLLSPNAISGMSEAYRSRLDRAYEQYNEVISKLEKCKW